MATVKKNMTNLLFEQDKHSKKDAALRLTQDSPIFPEVWKEFENVGTNRVDMILNPYYGVPATVLLKNLREKLVEIEGENQSEDWDLSTTGEYVVARLTFKELIMAALPLTKWWSKYLWTETDNKPTDDCKWLQKIVDFYADKFKQTDIIIPDKKKWEIPFSPSLWSISLNRNAFACIYESVPLTKADAGRRVFDIDSSSITWAVLDTGIDATHKGFRKINPTNGQLYADSMLPKTEQKSNQTRVVATYDFTKFRSLISLIFNENDAKSISLIEALSGFTRNDTNVPLDEVEINELISSINKFLTNGRMLDWSLISPLLRIPHNADDYEDKVPKHPHGTHVAGILGANDLIETDPKKRYIGMCPTINLYDIRVLDNNGQGDEFNILAAIQFVRWLNNQSDSFTIHGINLSLSIIHEVENFAAGRTPVCDACQRLVNEGTVVVAAAGNLGQSVFQNVKGAGSSDGYRSASITDPGNAENVITVGATHRSKPHTYGVSYFSSRGPTGDGRLKPDLVAPGEKIFSLIPGDKTKRMDGSSMAAPHVSGAAALLLATHKELVGQPQRVKEILCKTATDLGREKYFQGCGMLDVLRALQSV